MVSLGLFVTVVALMPNDFLVYQPDYNVPSAQSQEVIDYFDAYNITLYKSTWTFNSTYPDMDALENVPTTGHQIEFWWYGYPIKLIEVRHAFPSWFFGSWLDWHFMALPDGQMEIDKEELLDWAINENASYFEMRCDHGVTMNFLVHTYNESWTLSESWDNGYLTVLSSYEIDFDAMKPNAFTLITQLVFFQNPDLGFPYPLDEIVGYGFSIAFSITIIIIIYTLITRLIPIITGGVEN